MVALILFSSVFLLSLLGSSAAVMNNNLTSITWAHAVNDQAFLISVLKGHIEYIEADIVLGTLKGDKEDIIQPIMAHPPNTTSDLSLRSFLNQIISHNKETANAKHKKNVKLDFKSIEAFNDSLPLLRSLLQNLTFSVWINADIIAGPVNNTETLPLNATQFLNGWKVFDSSTLSVGWTTTWGSNFRDGTYTDAQIDDMINAVKSNHITNASITFPVRAGIAAYSQINLHRLVKAVNETNNVTLTIWSSAGDAVNIDLLRKLIFSFGVDKVYIDVPEELMKQLDLEHTPGRASSLIHFGMVTVVMLLTSFMFSNCRFS